MMALLSDLSLAYRCGLADEGELPTRLSHPVRTTC
jgi:hypothetical protein